MAHQIDTTSFQAPSFAFTGETPWHRIGTRLTELQAGNTGEVFRLANLGHKVSALPVFDRDGIVIAGYSAITREVDSRVFSVMSDKYTPVQDQELAQFIDPLVKEGELVFDAAFALRSGAITVLSLRRPETIKIGQDKSEVAQYVLAVNSHDGSHRVKLALTTGRAVCANTLPMALGKAEFTLNVKHTKNAAIQISEAGKALQHIGKYFGMFEEKANALAARNYTDSNLVELVDHLYPAQDHGGFTAQAETARNKIIDLFPNGAGHDSIRGTAWGAYNAVAEYADHHMRSRNSGFGAQDNSAYSVLFGSANMLKLEAETFITSQVGL